MREREREREKERENEREREKEAQIYWVDSQTKLVLEQIFGGPN